MHALQQFQFSIVHRPGRDHGNADGLSRVPSSPYRQCTRPDCPPAVEVTECADQPFDSESTSSSEDTDLIPINSGEDWVALLDDDLSQPSAIAGDSFAYPQIEAAQYNFHLMNTSMPKSFYHSVNNIDDSVFSSDSVVF